MKSRAEFGIVRYGLVALFLFTAIAKLAIVKAFVKNMGELLASSGFDYQRWSWPLTIVVIVAEIVTALLLILPRTVRIGALFAAVLLMGFAGTRFTTFTDCTASHWSAVVWRHHCKPLGVKTALRLLVPAIFVWFGYRRTGRSRLLASIEFWGGVGTVTGSKYLVEQTRRVCLSTADSSRV